MGDLFEALRPPKRSDHVTTDMPIDRRAHPDAADPVAAAAWLQARPGQSVSGGEGGRECKQVNDPPNEDKRPRFLHPSLPSVLFLLVLSLRP